MEKNPNCTCKRTACPRHGDCVECRAKHKTTLPSCERLPKKGKKERDAEASPLISGSEIK